MGGAYLKTPTHPFLRKHALYSAKGVIVKEKHPLGRLGLRYKKIIKNQMILNHFDKRPRCIA